jgi:hypothetical protein
VRTWARIATGGVAVLAGAALLLAAWLAEGLAESGDPGAPAVIVALGIAAVASGIATAFVAEARYAAIAILGAVFVLAFSGEVADDVVYETIAGVALVLLGLLSIIGGRGRRGARPASGAGEASRNAPSGEPSTPGGEPDDRVPLS